MYSKKARAVVSRQDNDVKQATYYKNAILKVPGFVLYPALTIFSAEKRKRWEDNIREWTGLEFNGENWLQNHLWCPNDPRG